jgi:hypothetical protein
MPSVSTSMRTKVEYSGGPFKSCSASRGYLGDMLHRPMTAQTQGRFHK